MDLGDRWWATGISSRSTNEFWKFSHDTPSVANCISRCFPVEPQLLKPQKCPYLWLHRERKFEKTTTRGLKSKGKINDLISLIARFKSILQLPDSWFYHTCGCQYWYQHTNVDASQSTAREDRVYLLKLANKQLLWDCTEGEGRRKKSLSKHILSYQRSSSSFSQQSNTSPRNSLQHVMPRAIVRNTSRKSFQHSELNYFLRSYFRRKKKKKIAYSWTWYHYNNEAK